MATTTNFGWETPDDTDLVKDGALAMRTLGNSIDTSFVDLKGGTTGQVLSKNSNTDLDFTWVAQDDSNAIQNAIVDAKGDLITATAADTPARLAVGTNGQVLTADSTTATGLKWATAASGSTFAGVSLFKSANQNVNHATVTNLTFDSELFDTDAYHSTTTNTSRITIPSGKAGYYQFIFLCEWNALFAGTRQARLLQNGALKHLSAFIMPNTEIALWSASIILNASVGDYFEFAVYQESGATQQAVGGAQNNTYFSAHLLGA
jgi:hypothetical protein